MILVEGYDYSHNLLFFDVPAYFFSHCDFEEYEQRIAAQRAVNKALLAGVEVHRI